ncbi:hypothetical protein B5X24_HaOG201958 [Helicoverpa armigera]|uniref:Uncharacterized protein n=1 Tax=Helicoverpa armigera TaxID=29058 RepID=A0A2W1BUI9_HELAM|nr:hypothetical protein B5X24_HaOG201958 [Helicoverpa armigera]
MVEKLCTHYGEKICEYEGETYYAFPEVDKLAHNGVESELRNLGFGYRAKFIHKSASQIVEWGGVDWFNSLQDMKYKDAKVELMKLYGIGPKIAAQNYLPHLRGKKNVTDKMYTEIGDHFRSLYGDMAGWAHTVLFCADLKKFQQSDTDTNDTGKPKKKRKKL